MPSIVSWGNRIPQGDPPSRDTFTTAPHAGDVGEREVEGQARSVMYVHIEFSRKRISLSIILAS